MGRGSCCGCMPKPASVQPRKTYNILIGELYSGNLPGLHDSLDSSARRKIQKLQEYCQKNPAKIPKVSRRLHRHIEATLRKPGNNLGVVKLSVYAYIYLLAMSLDETSSYSSSFFATELVNSPSCVVPVLLREAHIELRTLGAELLAVFARVQHEADNQLDAIQDCSLLVCRAARGALQADRAGQKVAETVARRQAGDVLAVPNPLDLIARRDPARVAALEATCLRCLLAVVGLCQQQRLLPAHLDQVCGVMLDNLGPAAAAAAGGDGGRSSRHSRASSGAGAGIATPATPSSAATPPAAAAAAAAADAANSLPGGPSAPPVPPGVLDPAFYTAMGVGELDQAERTPGALAGALLQQVGRFTHDVAHVQEVLAALYVYLDERSAWGQAGLTRALMTMLSSCGTHHTFLIYHSLLRHAASRRLGPGEAARCTELGLEAGAGLEAGYSLTALVVALTELPRVWGAALQRGPRQPNLQAFLDLFRVGPRISASGAAAGMPADAGSPSPRPSLAAAPLAAPAAVVSASGTATAAAAPAAGLGMSAAGGPGSTAAVAGSDISTANSLQLPYPQQLAALKEVILSGVAALASRVTSSAELAEALSSAMKLTAVGGRSAASTGGGAAAGAPGAPAGASLPAGSAAAAAGSGGASGDGQGYNSQGGANAAGAAAAGGSSTEGAAEGSPQVTEAVAAMTIECAAAAVAAAPCTAPGASPAQRALPGGVLPAGLVVGAVPLLARWPLPLRRGLYDVLGAFLPGAPHGVGDKHAAAALVPLLVAELHRMCGEEVGREEVTPRLITMLDGLLRATLPEAQPPPPSAAAAAGYGADGNHLQQQQQPPPLARPRVVLVLAQRLLAWAREQLARPGGAGGLCSAQPWRGAAAVLLVNSWLQLLAGVAGVPQLAQQVLPLRGPARLALQGSGITNSTPTASLMSVCGPAPPPISGNGLTQADQQAAAAELEALDQHLAKAGALGGASNSNSTPNGSQAGGAVASGAAATAARWSEALARSPLLLGAYGRGLGELLEEGQGPDQRSDSVDGLPSATKQQLADKVNTLLLKRMGTLRRDLAHVSELMRDSFSRINDPPPPVATLVSHGHTRSSSGGGSVGPSSPHAAVAAGGVLLEELEEGVGGERREAPRRTSSHPSPYEPLTPAAADIAAAAVSGAPTPNAGASPAASPRPGRVDEKAAPVAALPPKAAAALAGSAAGLSADQVKLNKINKGVLDVLQRALKSPDQQQQRQQFVVGDVQIRALAIEVEPVVGLNS